MKYAVHSLFTCIRKRAMQGSYCQAMGLVCNLHVIVSRTKYGNLPLGLNHTQLKRMLAILWDNIECDINGAVLQRVVNLTHSLNCILVSMLVGIMFQEPCMGMCLKTIPLCFSFVNMTRHNAHICIPDMKIRRDLMFLLYAIQQLGHGISTLILKETANGR